MTAKEAWRLFKIMRHKKEERLKDVLLILFPGATCLIPRCNPVLTGAPGYTACVNGKQQRLAAFR